MKNNIILILCAVVLIVLLVITICIRISDSTKGADQTQNPNSVTDKEQTQQEAQQISRSIDKVKLTIKEGTLTRKGATIIIADSNSQPYSYGEWFALERKNGDNWQEVPTVIEDYGFNDIGYELNQAGELSLNVKWEWLYGSLSNGQYKIKKSIYDNGQYLHFECEFEITEEIQ